MDIRKATIDQILMELARRDQKFIFMFLDSPRTKGGAELHYCNVSVKQSATALNDAVKLVNEMLDGKKPDNVSIFKRVAVNGKLVEQVEIEDVKQAIDPWQVEINKIGEYDPWIDKEEKTETGEGNDGEGNDDDPWKETN